LKGLLESRDEIVGGYLDKLDKLAYTFMKKINDLHFEGFGSDGKSQRIFFDVYNGVIDGYPEKFAARSIRVNRELQLDVTKLAAAQADPYNTSPEGLPVSEGVGSGENALNMAKLKFDLTMENGTSTFNEYFNQIISDIGTKANEASRVQQNQELLLQKLENVRQQVSGVSLDEEMTNMVKFQHAYNASARVISTINQMLDTVISLGK
jgi:flagellar hook-associated protein 1 FlgK